jgi:uncharacterized protein (DUF488 family)
VNAVYTIGYEGADLGDFIETLRKADIDLLLDVRELPLSRRKGFSKSALRASLETAGIGYAHEKKLGSPKSIRNELRETKDLGRFFAKFAQYLTTQDTLLHETIDRLDGRVVLMCYEKDVNTCHRKTVADRFGAILGVDPCHLGVQKSVSKRKAKAAHVRTRQSLPAAESAI